MMEDKRSGQNPEQDDKTATDATAGRTRPTDAPDVPPSDRDSARAAARVAEKEVETMHARGFGSHKGTEAD